jgi:hypothetical protein
MASAQDWCLQCGAGAPDSLDAGGPSWRSATTILAVTAILVLGAAAAAYAALSKEGPRGAHPQTVALAPSTASPAPPATTPGAVTPTPTPTPGAVTPSPTPTLPTGPATPPKIPLTAPTPKPTTTPSPAAKESPGAPTSPATGNKKSSGGTATEKLPAAIVLDTDAAATYDPYGYPTSEFGDPSLAIDGDPTTGWTAQVNPAVAPKMAEGLVIDLKTAQRLSAVELITSTPGMSVQVYGANGHTLPTSITDPAWTQLSPYLAKSKRKMHIKLRDSAKAFRFVTLWISKASAASIGTVQAPGHVSVNELELFPAK